MSAGYRIRVIPYSLPLRRPLITASGTWRERRGWWIQIRRRDGRIGLGEVAPPKPVEWGSGEGIREALVALARAPGQDSVVPPVTGIPSIDAALELAMLDLEGQDRGQKIAEIFGGDPGRSIPCNALLAAAEPAALADEAAAAAALGYRCMKIKIGARSLEGDVERLAAVRDRVGPAISLRADANGSWDVSTAIRALNLLEPFNLEYVEQPVAADLAAVRRRSHIPIAADESARSPEGARDLIRQGALDVLILKPMAIGGIRETLAIADEARDKGIPVVVTSVLDTAVGVAGALHAAAALPGPEVACGLATIDLFARMPVHGLPRPSRGRMELPAAPGLGLHLESDAPD